MLDLEAIELIKQLKARYFRYLDTIDYDGLRSVFSDDVRAHFSGGDYDFTCNGWGELETFYRRAITPEKFGTHNGHHPEITVDGETATGIWYLSDTFYYFKRKLVIRGTSLYTDSYRKQNGEWLICGTGYKRIYEEWEPMRDDVTVAIRPGVVAEPDS